MRRWWVSIVRPSPCDSNGSACIPQSRAVGSSGPKYPDACMISIQGAVGMAFSKMHPTFL